MGIIYTYFIILLITLLYNFVNSWHNKLEFDFISYKNKSNENKLFESIYLNHDYFSLLSFTRNNHFNSNKNKQLDNIFIGARNHLYELSLPDLKIINNQTWLSSQLDVMKCLNRTIINNKDECDNYIKVYFKVNDDIFRICSTNALNPKCRFYHYKENNKNAIIINETSGIGFSPIRAYENKYAYNYVVSTKTLYTANSIDLNRYFTSINKGHDEDRISTNVDDNNWLYRADFISSFSNDERIFFVFNEDATIDESTSSLNEGKRIAKRYSSISQICLNDHGAPLNSLRNIWTSYLKTRLSCFYDLSKLSDSIKLESTFRSSSLFYFDEVTSISEVFTSSKSKKSYFYATFTTESTEITASAVCKFTLDQIMESFHGSYKYNNENSPNNKEDQEQIPSPHPSECKNKLTYQHLMFTRKNVQMKNEVLSEALIIESSISNRFTSIDVDFEAKNHINKQESDVLFIGTDNGEVLTFVIQSNKKTYSEKLIVFDTKDQNIHLYNKTFTDRYNDRYISNIKLYHNKENLKSKRHLIIVTQNKVLSIPFQTCHLKLEENKCNNLIYPYCIWSNSDSKCISTSDEVKNILFNKTEKSLNSFSTLIQNTTKFLVDGTFDTIKIKQLKSSTLTAILLKPASIDLNKYKFQNNEITISMNLLMFSIMIISFLISSFMLGALFTLHFYRKFKISKDNIIKSQKKSHNIYNGYGTDMRDLTFESCKKTNINKFLVKLFSCKKTNENIPNKKISCVSVVSSICSNSQQPSPFLVSSSVCSSQSFETNTKSSSLCKTNLNDYESRFVYSNNINNDEISKQDSTLEKSEKTIMEKTNFLDYDDSEYFSLKKKQNENIIKQTKFSSNSSPILSNNSNSLASLIKVPLNSNNHNVNIYTSAHSTLVYNQKNSSSNTNTINRYYI